MLAFGNKYLSFLGLCLTIALCCGCLDSPARQLWYRKQWQEDEKYGPTFHTRLQELATLRDNAEDLSDEEQRRLVPQLLQALAQDPSPLYRSEVVRTLAVLPSPAAIEGLHRAVQDPDPTVRIAACQAWAQRGSAEAAGVLSRIVGSDADLDVRMAATRALARFKGPEAVGALGLALDDPDPALQHRAVESLKEVTGQDLGNSVPAWRQFVRNGVVPTVDEPTLAERLRAWF